MKQRVVAIIPARGGSKGIPRKNVLPFCGKPLLAYSVEAALGALCVNEVYVSTEDKEIADISKALGASIIDRPSEFASDTASTFSVINHAWHFLGKPDVLITLQPTSPLRTSRHIDEGFALFDSQTETVIGVCATHRYQWRIENGIGIPDFLKRQPRQLMEKKFIENGSLYISRSAVFERDDDILGMGISSSGKVVLYVMADEFAVEIDSIADFEILESIKQRLDRRI